MKCRLVGEDHGEQHVDAEHERVGRDAFEQREADERDEHGGAEHLERARGRAQRVLDLGGIAHGRLRTAEQAVGPHDQHDRHHQELGDEGELGEIHREAAEVHHADADAQRLDLGDDDGGEIGAGDRAHPAHHHDDEGIAEHGEVHGEVRRLARELQRAAEAGKERAAGEHDGEQHGLVDAERADHLAVLRGGPHEPAEAGPGEDEMQRDEDERADRNRGTGHSSESCGPGFRPRRAGPARAARADPRCPRATASRR